MKKLIIGVVLAGSLTAAVAATLNTSHKKDAAKTEKKAEKKKRNCGHSCPFSSI
jgi:hypothetical protein